jgi:hypothetical protein
VRGGRHTTPHVHLRVARQDPCDPLARDHAVVGEHDRDCHRFTLDASPVVPVKALLPYSTGCSSARPRVEAHVARVLEKLNLRDRVQAVVLAHRDSGELAHIGTTANRTRQSVS